MRGQLEQRPRFGAGERGPGVEALGGGQQERRQVGTAVDMSIIWPTAPAFSPYLKKTVARAVARNRWDGGWGMADHGAKGPKPGKSLYP